MLDWLFGSSKKQKKEEPQGQSLEKEEEWVYDFVRQYLVSPIWRNPLLDFVEENCGVFEDAEQNKFQYTKIFQEFVSICSILIQSIVEQTGITYKTLEKCIVKGLKSQNDKKIFTQILICDNFEMFKRIMISKNKQLETEALKKIRDETKTQDKVQDKIDLMERQRLQIEEAIALSLALEQKAKEQQEQELQEAIRQSQLSLSAEENKVEKKAEEKTQKMLLGDLPPLMLGNVKTFQSAAGYKQQKERLNKQINELKANHKPEEDSQERKRRLQQQRELLRKRKQQQRQAQLQTFVDNKQATSIPEHKVSEEELQRRKKLMNRLKDQLRSD